MTKTHLAKTIVEMVDNFRDAGDTQSEIIEAVESLLDTLEPKDLEQFSKWGQNPDEKSTPAECWK